MIKNNVIIGHDGWLFLNSGAQKQREHLNGTLLPTAVDVENFRQNITSRFEFCRSHGMDYLHVVFPTKDLVTREMLPTSYAAEQSSLFDRCYRGVFGDHLPEYLVYPLDELIELHSQKSAFFKFDTHLSAIGRLHIVSIILAKLGLPCDPVPYFIERDLKHSGDLGKMLQSSETSDETWLDHIIPTAKTFNNITYLKGNSNNIVIVSNDLAVFDKRLLVFGDSFIAGCLSILSAFFKDIIYIRSPFFQKDAVSLFSPDIIVSANSERYLSAVKSDTSSHSVVLANYGAQDYRPSDEFSDALRAQASWGHHHSYYTSWRNKNIPKPLYVDPVLGPAFGNAMLVRVNELERSFSSVGRDPQLIFPRAGLALLSEKTISFEIESSVDGKCQLFYPGINEKGYPFLNQDSLSLDVKQGRNILTFKLDRNRSIPLIRFDPLATPGVFTILSTRAW